MRSGDNRAATGSKRGATPAGKVEQRRTARRLPMCASHKPSLNLTSTIQLGNRSSGRQVIGRYWFSLKNTPKAFANFSPRLELATTLGTNSKIALNHERVRSLANPFRV